MQSSGALIPKYSELVCNGFWFSPESTRCLVFTMKRATWIETHVAQSDIPGKNSDWRKGRGMVKTTQTRSESDFAHE
jgi:argininosuccinate synthase